MSKNRDGKDSEHRKRKDEILFIDARKLGKMATRRLRVLEDEDVKKVAETYHQWRNLNGIYNDIDGFCKSATLEEVKANINVLTPGRYVGTEAEEDDGVPFEEKMKHLTEKLMDQFNQSRELEERKTKFAIARKLKFIIWQASY